MTGKKTLAAALAAELMAILCVAAVGGCAMAGNSKAKAPETTLVTYEAPKEITASPLYTVTVNGREVFVYPCAVSRAVDDKGNLLPDRHQTTQTSPAAFCYFDFGGQADVAVTLRAPSAHLPLTAATVRPLRHDIDAAIEGETIRFQLDGPCKLSVEPNGSIWAPLFIFANPLEEDAPKPDDPRVTYFGPGVHRLKDVMRVESDSTVYIAGGAVVYGHFDTENVSGARVLGRGILDSSGVPVGPRQMRWFKSKDIVVDGIVMVDSPSWGIQVAHCDDVLIRNVKIITGRGADGIDICSSEDVIVDDVFARTHDDTLNIKGLTDERFGYPADAKGRWLPTGNRKAVRNVRFTNCVVWNDRAHALMIGPETRATRITDVLFRDIDIIHALSVDVIGIFSSDAAEISNVRYENIRIEDPRVMTLLEIRVHQAYTTADSQFGAVRDVVFRNLEVTTPTPLYSALCADSNTIERVTFENWRINGKIMTNAEEAKLLMRGDVKDVRFLAHGK